MDWKALLGSMQDLVQKDYPARTGRMIALQRVLNGTQYDHLPHDFATETNASGEYVPLRDRRPSSRSNFCRVVVDDSVSLLFGDGHMPTVQADAEDTRSGLAHLMKVHSFGNLMMEAATQGSCGSVAIRFRVLKRRPFFDVLTTEYLTPKWEPENPIKLDSVTEKRKVRADDLIAMGYKVDRLKGDHWFQRIWDQQAENWFIPWPVSDSDHEPVVDTQRTVTHALGFVPMIWIRNLPGGASPDGDSTFERAIDTVTEHDYLMSQGSRGLRYSSDPTLVLKGPDDTGGQKTGGAARALVVAPEGDAKLLEINGSAAGAVVKHCQELRVQAIEQMHGNRAHPDKMTAAQSGRAMELLNQGLVWLAGKLRTSYGEGALLQLLQMVCDTSKILKGLIIHEGQEPVVLDDKGLWLKWPDWYPPTADDRMAEMNAFGTGLQHGVISRQTAVQTAMAFYDMQDLQAELERIKSDQAEEDARLAKQAAKVAAAENVPT